MVNEIRLVSFETIIWAVCIIGSAVILFANCTAQVIPGGYIGHVCTEGLDFVDIFFMLFLAPLYFLFLLVITNAGVKFW
jgi:hypothetical protein